MASHCLNDEPLLEQFCPQAIIDKRRRAEKKLRSLSKKREEDTAFSYTGNLSTPPPVPTTATLEPPRVSNVVFVSFRDSLLARVLSSMLTGPRAARLLFICTASPALSQCDRTVNTLLLGHVARDIFTQCNPGKSNGGVTAVQPVSTSHSKALTVSVSASAPSPTHHRSRSRTVDPSEDVDSLKQVNHHLQTTLRQQHALIQQQQSEIDELRLQLQLLVARIGPASPEQTRPQTAPAQAPFANQLDHI